MSEDIKMTPDGISLHQGPLPKGGSLDGTLGSGPAPSLVGSPLSTHSNLC